MRVISYLFVLTLSLAGPVIAQKDRQTIRIHPEYRHGLSVAQMFSRVAYPQSAMTVQLRASERSAAESVHGLIALYYEADNSLIVQGSSAGLEAFKSALAVVDVPIARIDGGERLVVTLRRGDPATVRAAALGLGGNGRVRVSGKTLRFEGNRAWLEEVVEVVFRSELPMVAFKQVQPTYPRAFVKLGLTHQDPAAWFDRVRTASVATGVIVTPAYEERSFGFRGDVDELAAIGSALSVIDVPVERAAGGARAVIQLRRASPERFEQQARQLPGAGTTEKDGSLVQLKGSAAWIQSALGLALRLELEQ